MLYTKKEIHSREGMNENKIKSNNERTKIITRGYHTMVYIVENPDI